MREKSQKERLVFKEFYLDFDFCEVWEPAFSDLIAPSLICKYLFHIKI